MGLLHNEHTEEQGQSISNQEQPKLNGIQVLDFVVHVVDDVSGSVLKLNVSAINQANLVKLIRHFIIADNACVNVLTILKLVQLSAKVLNSEINVVVFNRDLWVFPKILIVDDKVSHPLADIHLRGYWELIFKLDNGDFLVRVLRKIWVV